MGNVPSASAETAADDATAEVELLVSTAQKQLALFKAQVTEIRATDSPLKHTEVTGGRTLRYKEFIKVNTTNGLDKQIESAVGDFFSAADGSKPAKKSVVSGLKKMVLGAAGAFWGASSAGETMQKDFCVTFLNNAFVRLDVFLWLVFGGVRRCSEPRRVPMFHGRDSDGRPHSRRGRLPPFRCSRHRRRRLPQGAEAGDQPQAPPGYHAEAVDHRERKGRGETRGNPPRDEQQHLGSVRWSQGPPEGKRGCLGRSPPSGRNGSSRPRRRKHSGPEDGPVDGTGDKEHQAGTLDGPMACVLLVEDCGSSTASWSRARKGQPGVVKRSQNIGRQSITYLMSEAEVKSSRVVPMWSQPVPCPPSLLTKKVSCLSS